MAVPLALFTITATALPPAPGYSPEDVLIWPKPQQHSYTTTRYRVLANSFSFTLLSTKLEEKSEAILASGFERYRAICFPGLSVEPPNGDSALETVSGLFVTVVNASASLSLETSEKYTLTVSAGNATLTADTVFGALRGLETFSQLLQPDFTIRESTVNDWPRFPFRATMIDTSRHYLPVSLIQAHIDTMAYNKMNVLHWHITDSPSFPFVSTAFPDLSEKGAFSATHVYSPENVAGLVDYGLTRGVIILPEFDSPGHTFPSWGLGGPPDLLTACPSPSTDNTGPLRVDRDETYAFLQTLLDDVATVFPGELFHAGGDEVSFECWKSNKDVMAWMASHGMGSNLTILNNYYAQRLLTIVSSTMNRSAMLWRPGMADLLDQALIPQGTVFDVYGPYPKEQGTSVPGSDYGKAATRTTAAGHRVVRSAGMYLDQLCDPDPDGRHKGTYWGFFQGWIYYNSSHDPLFGLDPTLGARPELVIGAKANMWGEHVDAANFMPRVWPRASVIAERVWSAVNVTNVTEAEPRLHEFRCRLVRRGIAAAPIGSFNFGEDGPYHKCYCRTELNFQYAPPAPPPPGLVLDGPTMSLIPPRREVAAAAVGSVLLFAGGMSTTGEVTDAVDLFDLARGGERTSLTLAAPRAFDGGQNVAVACRGKVFVAGGAYANGSKSDLVDVFDLGTRKFEEPLTLSAGRSFLAVAALEKEGLVFFGGGELAEDENHPENSADADVVDIWSVDKHAWLPTAKLTVGRKKLSATSLGDELVLFAGGFRSNMEGQGYRREVDIFNVTSGVWSSAVLAQGRMRLASAASGNCAVFAGGEVNTTNNDGSGIVDLYCDGQWSVTELSIRRYELASAALGKYLYFGGGNGGVRNFNPLAGSRVDVLDTTTLEWSHIDLPTPRDRLGAVSTLENGGLVCFSGGGVDGALIDCLHT